MAYRYNKVQYGMDVNKQIITDGNNLSANTNKSLLVSTCELIFRHPVEMINSGSGMMKRSLYAKKRRAKRKIRFS